MNKSLDNKIRSLEVTSRQQRKSLFIQNPVFIVFIVYYLALCFPLLLVCISVSLQKMSEAGTVVDNNFKRIQFNVLVLVDFLTNGQVLRSFLFRFEMRSSTLHVNNWDLRRFQISRNAVSSVALNDALGLYFVKKHCS